MPNFNGKIDEIPNIVIDNFEDYTFDAFFLSHCHWDHMRGLLTNSFFKHLIENNKFLYLSDVSYEILKHLIKHSDFSNLKKLDMFGPNFIKLKDKIICVTVIPAGHCPGSIMFLFEDEKNILYTGDYRIYPNDFKKIKAFYNKSNVQKKIDKIYLDTTFFLKKYKSFPLRGESIKIICDKIEDILINDKNKSIYLKTSAQYGYEYLFRSIYERFKIPIHVKSDVYEFYTAIPDMDNVVTKNSDLTNIHSCSCPQYKFSISFRISAFYWDFSKLKYAIYDNNRICYSTHASYEESIAFIKFIKPIDIYSFVEHDNETDREEVLNNIEDILRELNNNECNDICDRKKLKLSQFAFKLNNNGNE